MGWPMIDALPCCRYGVAVLLNDAPAADDSRDLRLRSIVYETSRSTSEPGRASPRPSDPTHCKHAHVGIINQFPQRASLMASMGVAGKRVRSTIVAEPTMRT